MGVILTKYRREFMYLLRYADSSELVTLAAGLPLLFFQFLHPIINWKNLFRRVPFLFDLRGRPYTIAGKWSLFILPLISLVIVHDYLFAPGVTKLFTMGGRHDRMAIFLSLMLLISYYATTQVRVAQAKQAKLSGSLALYLLSAAASSLFYAIWRDMQNYRY